MAIAVAAATTTSSLRLPLSNPNHNLFSSSSSTSYSHLRHGRRRNLPSVLRVATPTPISKDDPKTLEIEQSFASDSTSSESFSWRDKWYPVSLIEALDPRLPTPFQLLNRDIMPWKDPKAGDRVAFDDRCPHCLAPLSEGRIDEDGCLQCSYHGWSFDGKGTCSKIPQAASEGLEAQSICSLRANVAKLPTLVSQGLLFVWPDENGWEKVLKTNPPLLGFQEKSFLFRIEGFVRKIS